jgi:hypothetical protein
MSENTASWPFIARFLSQLASLITWSQGKCVHLVVTSNFNIVSFKNPPQFRSLSHLMLSFVNIGEYRFRSEDRSGAGDRKQLFTRHSLTGRATHSPLFPLMTAESSAASKTSHRAPASERQRCWRLARARGGRSRDTSGAVEALGTLCLMIEVKLSLSATPQISSDTDFTHKDFNLYRPLKTPRAAARCPAL